MELEKHYTNRTGWLRAAVLGANDGIISTSSLVIGVAAASDSRPPIALAALAGLIAGALSMAAGEYVSVSSQADLEKADIDREKKELETMPEVELAELAKIYVGQGLDEDLAMKVAIQFSQKDALGAHMRDELGITEHSQPKPLQAAFASGSAFVSGGILPFMVALFAPISTMVFYQYGFAIVFLAISGAIAAKAGGSGILKGMARICFWGTVAMVVTALAGYIFDAKTS